jgi:hypothetical protein
MHLLAGPKGRKLIARGVNPWSLVGAIESSPIGATEWVTYSRPVGARFLRCELNQGLTPLAINDRRVAAETSAGRCITLKGEEGERLSCWEGRAGAW